MLYILYEHIICALIGVQSLLSTSGQQISISPGCSPSATTHWRFDRGACRQGMGARRDEVGSPHFVLENQNHATLSVPRYCFSPGCFVI